MAEYARASVLTAPNGQFIVEEQPVPALGPGQFLLRTELAGVCGTDVHIYKGRLPGIQYPLVLGHEVVGIIDRVGAGPLTDFEGQPVGPGDRVIPMPATPDDGMFENVSIPGPLLRYPAYDVTGFTQTGQQPLAGGMAEKVYFWNPRTRFFKTTMAPELAVLAEPFATPVHAVQRLGLAPGVSVLVQGTGAIGLLAIAAAITYGATQVIVIGGPAHRLEIAKAFGADIVIDIDQVKDPQERIRIVREHTRGGHGVDVVIEGAGIPAAFVEGLECLRNGGRYAELGHFTDNGSVTINPWKHILAKNVTMIGSSGYNAQHFMQGIRLLERHAFPYEMMVTHRVALARVQEAMRAMTAEGGWQLDQVGAAKIAIDPSLS